MAADDQVVLDAGLSSLPRRGCYRSREQRVLIMLGGYCGSSSVAVMGLGLIDVAGAGLGAAAMLLTAGMMFVITWRCARAGVRVDETHVTIVNPRRSFAIEWSMLERFSVGTEGPWSRVGIAHLRDGSRMTIWGIQGPNPATRPNNRSTEKLIDALNVRLRSMPPRGS